MLECTVIFRSMHGQQHWMLIFPMHICGKTELVQLAQLHSDCSPMKLAQKQSRRCASIHMLLQSTHAWPRRRSDAAKVMPKTHLPEDFPHGIGVLASSSCGRVQWFCWAAYVKNTDRSVIEAHCQQVGMLWVEVQAHHTYSEAGISNKMAHSQNCYHMCSTCITSLSAQTTAFMLKPCS